MTSAPHPAILLVRHGHTEWNLAHRIQGRSDIPLNDDGRRDARRAAITVNEWRARHQWAAEAEIISSPLARAAETAREIAANISPGPVPLPISMDESLVERHFGEAEGMSVADAARLWPGLEGIPGAETLTEVGLRAGGAFSHYVKTHPGCVVVGHGQLIRYGLTHLLGDDLPRVLNGEVWELRYRSGRWVAGRVPGQATNPAQV